MDVRCSQIDKFAKFQSSRNNNNKKMKERIKMVNIHAYKRSVMWWR